jgi:hypothetical protein
MIKNILNKQNRKLTIFYFSDKIPKSFPFEDFKLTTDKNINFVSFYEQMMKNVKTGMSNDLNNPKLLQNIKNIGIDKTKEEIEALTKMAKIREKEEVNNLLK